MIRTYSKAAGLLPISAFGGESLTKGNSLYAYPAGASFCADKRMQKRFRAAP